VISDDRISYAQAPVTSLIHIKRLVELTFAPSVTIKAAMDYHQLSPHHAVAPQITPEDVPAIAAAGFRTIICNRPDPEVFGPIRAENIRAAAEAVGVRFVEIPFTHSELSPRDVQRQQEAMASSDGPSLAYCASGTRSAIMWLFASAQTIPTDELLEAVTRAGFPLGSLRTALERAARG
jgi:uncharacterized protein (TIGR01244 family)